MLVLLHSSKTMRRPTPGPGIGIRELTRPALLAQAAELVDYLRGLSVEKVAEVMAVSTDLAARTRDQFLAWTPDGDQAGAAVESFIGDIYSGLRVGELTPAERDHAQQHLRILSGLYGLLRPDDAICGYRLEMGYSLPDPRYRRLPAFWADSVAGCLPPDEVVVNLAAVEYSRAVTPFLKNRTVITPKFLTVDPKTGARKFVVVHAKIARGRFARWLITERPSSAEEIWQFDDIGYRHDPEASTRVQPVFVCANFEGKGLSVRLQ